MISKYKYIRFIHRHIPSLIRFDAFCFPSAIFWTTGSFGNPFFRTGINSSTKLKGTLWWAMRQHRRNSSINACFAKPWFTKVSKTLRSVSTWLYASNFTLCTSVCPCFWSSDFSHARNLSQTLQWGLKILGLVSLVATSPFGFPKSFTFCNQPANSGNWSHSTLKAWVYYFLIAGRFSSESLALFEIGSGCET